MSILAMKPTAQRTPISRALVTCLALGILVACSSENSTRSSTQASSGGADGSNAGNHRSRIEDVYVVLARFSSPNLPVTSFCDAARFPADYPVERERHYEYWSTTTQQDDGLLVNANVQHLGGHHGCYSVNKNGMIYSYMTGTVVGVPFTARGTCVFNPERAPEPGVSPYTCNYAMSDLPEAYIGGQSTWNGVTTDISGYLTTTIGSIRLWKRPSAR
jgi:hypothetical protein